jgi:hypothetical protein
MPEKPAADGDGQESSKSEQQYFGTKHGADRGGTGGYSNEQGNDAGKGNGAREALL